MDRRNLVSYSQLFTFALRESAPDLIRAACRLPIHECASHCGAQYTLTQLQEQLMPYAAPPRKNIQGFEHFWAVHFRLEAVFI